MKPIPEACGMVLQPYFEDSITHSSSLSSYCGGGLRSISLELFKIDLLFCSLSWSSTIGYSIANSRWPIGLSEKILLNGCYQLTWWTFPQSVDKACLQKALSLSHTHTAMKWYNAGTFAKEEHSSCKSYHC